MSPAIVKPAIECKIFLRYVVIGLCTDNRYSHRSLYPQTGIIIPYPICETIADGEVNPMKMVTVSFGLILAILLTCAGCTSTTPAPVPTMTPAATTPPGSNSGYTDLTAAQAKDLIDTEKELIIIDVSPYYDQGHLPGAISIPLATLDEKIPALDKTGTYLVYCHGDSPSIAGAQKLVDAGFMKVYRLAGNYAAWVDAGYMVEK
jgi:rhodanese-related sulfurtransferase